MPKVNYLLVSKNFIFKKIDCCRFWFLFVAILTFVNFIYHFITMLFASRRENTVETLLTSMKLDYSGDTDKRIIRMFVHKMLRPG